MVYSEDTHVAQEYTPVPSFTSVCTPAVQYGTVDSYGLAEELKVARGEVEDLSEVDEGEEEGVDVGEVGRCR